MAKGVTREKVIEYLKTLSSEEVEELMTYADSERRDDALEKVNSLIERVTEIRRGIRVDLTRTYTVGIVGVLNPLDTDESEFSELEVTVVDHNDEPIEAFAEEIFNKIEGEVGQGDPETGFSELDDLIQIGQGRLGALEEEAEALADSLSDVEVQELRFDHQECRYEPLWRRILLTAEAIVEQDDGEVELPVATLGRAVAATAKKSRK